MDTSVSRSTTSSRHFSQLTCGKCEGDDQSSRRAGRATVGALERPRDPASAPEAASVDRQAPLVLPVARTAPTAGAVD